MAETGLDVADISDGVYQISLPGQHVLSMPESDPGAPLRLLPPGGLGVQWWQVERADSGDRTIRDLASGLYLSFDGEPDPMEPARAYPRPRAWRLSDGPEPNTVIVGVPDTALRLGRSLLRIFPPFVALTPPLAEPGPGWTFQPAP